MKKDNEQTLKEAINKLLETYKLQDKLEEVEIINCWNRLMGEPISKYTEKIFVRKKCLYLKINSAPLKQELFYAREQIRDRLNEELGTDALEMVVLL